MYTYIVNPNSNRKVKTSSKLGKNIISNYYEHYYDNNKTTGGSIVIPITFIVAIGNLGYYYYQTSVTPERSGLKDLNNLDYLHKNFPKLAQKLERTLVMAEEIRLKIEEDLKNSLTKDYFGDITISNEEEDELESELNKLIAEGKSGGAMGGAMSWAMSGAIGGRLVFRLGGVSVMALVTNYIWENYLVDTMTDETLDIPTLPSRIEGGWVVVEVPTPTVSRSLDKGNALEKIKSAKLNLLKRYHLLNNKLGDVKYKRLRPQIEKEIKNIKGQLRNLLLIEKNLGIKGAKVSAKV